MDSVGSDILESNVKEAIVGKKLSSPKAIHKFCCYIALLIAVLFTLCLFMRT